MLLQIKLVITKVFTFKFENVAFTKLPKKLMIRHNKIYKMIEFFIIFIMSFYFEELYSGTTSLFWEWNPYIRPLKYCLHSFNEYKPVRKT